MVDCARFLDAYSDYRDGLLPLAEMELLDAHRAGCEGCARYDRVIGGGVDVFRSLESITPAPDFQERLRERIWSVDRAAAAHASGASLPVTLMISVALAAGAWLPTLAIDDEPVRLPPIVAHAPYHDLTPSLYRGAPMAQSPGFPVQGYYGQGLLLDQSQHLTMLAYRPTQSLYSPR